MNEDESLIQSWGGFRQWNCFSEKVTAAFTERAFNTSNSRHFVRSIGFPENHLQRVRQVHGDQIQVIHKGLPLPDRNECEADGLISNQPHILLGILTADCLPVFFEDEATATVGLVHAGWRGLKQRILTRAVESFNRDFGSRPADLKAAIGPAIRQCCYETDAEFKDYFPNFYRESDRGNGKLKVDLVAAAKAELTASGIAPNRIYDSRICTACQYETFFSARKGAVSERILSVIGLR